MIKEYELKTTLQNYLISNPGSPAKRIVRDLRWDFPNLSKRDINPILYREKQIFRSEGRTPPIWFSIDANPVRLLRLGSHNPSLILLSWLLIQGFR